MAGEGPYLESNQPYNPIPGLIAGSVIGGGGLGLTAFGTTAAINFNRSRGPNRNQKRINRTQSAIEKMAEQIPTLRQQAYGDGPLRRTPQDRKAARKYDRLQNSLRSKNETIERLKAKQFKPKISGGRNAAIIGGTALAGAIIGGTAGVFGNYS